MRRSRFSGLKSLWTHAAKTHGGDSQSSCISMLPSKRLLLLHPLQALSLSLRHKLQLIKHSIQLHTTRHHMLAGKTLLTNPVIHLWLVCCSVKKRKERRRYASVRSCQKTLHVNSSSSRLLLHEHGLVSACEQWQPEAGASSKQSLISACEQWQPKASKQVGTCE